MLYGPTDKQAIKIVASILPAAKAAALATRKWTSAEGDIRENASVQAELSGFFKEHRVAQAVVTEEIIGCPHEEGIDYQSGGTCTECPFWATHPNSRGRLLERKTPGRNDPCSSAVSATVARR